jgi:hypothetical protein
MSRFTRFKQYTDSELKDCGHAFVHFLRTHEGQLNRGLWRDKTWPWTELVMEWFASTTPKQIVCDARLTPHRRTETWTTLREALNLPAPVQRSGGEFLVADLIHSNYPSYQHANYWTPEYWTQALGGADLRIRMALESEWKGKTDRAAYSCVMHSASKLASIRADVKVLVFGSWSRRDDSPMNHRSVIADIQKLRALADGGSGWLVIDVPWAAWQGEVKPRAWIACPDAEVFEEIP